MKKYLLLLMIAIIAFLFIGGSCGNKNISDSKNDNQKQYTTSINPGEKVDFISDKLVIAVSGWQNQTVKFYNTKLGKKTIYFFVAKDKDGIIRAAGNACQVCFSAKKGFHVEGNELVCNNCGNRYPLEKIATEKGGCNPIPISPNLKIDNVKISISQTQIQGISSLF